MDSELQQQMELGIKFHAFLTLHSGKKSSYIQSQPGCGDKEKSCASFRNETLVIQPIASHFTDSPLVTHGLLKYIFYYFRLPF
jgi:hypothetical protein